MLLRYEIKKILFSPALIGFAVLCAALNVFIARSLYKPDAMSGGEPYNVFEGYDAGALADGYVARYGMRDGAERNIRGKYGKLQPVIDQKAENGDALSAYFGQETYIMHGHLFGTTLFAVAGESCLFALFAALTSTGYENARNTEQLVCASKTGRTVSRTKLAASLLTGLLFFAVILVSGLAVFFARFDFSAVWGDNVSSSFNSAPGNYLIPFMTWRSFTVAGLLGAVTVAAAGLTAVFSLFGTALGTFFRGGYIACGAAIVLCVLQYMAPLFFQTGGTLRGALNLTPLMLWANSGKWFTDGGPEIAWANFESAGILACLAALAAAGLAAAAFYRRRDLV
jgi:hypothetical protein